MKAVSYTHLIVINKDGEFVTDTTLMKGHWYDFIFNYFKDSLAGVTFDVYAKEDIAVSYTHLDVYKRQQKAPASGNKEAGGNQSNAGNGGQTTDCLLYTSAMCL